MPDFDKHKHLAKVPKQNLLGFVLDKLSEFIEGDQVKFVKKSKKPDLISFILKHGTDSNIPSESGFKIYKKPVDFIGKLFKSLPKITDDEQKRIIEENIALYRGNKRKFDIGLKLPSTEGKTEEQIKEIRQIEMNKLIELEPHQKAFLNGFLLSGIHGAIAFHGVGTGKTFTAVAVSRLYLKLYPENKVLFVCPPALLANFIESLIAYGIDPRDKRYQYYTYDGFYRSGITAENSLLIIDEAHNFRTQVPNLIDEEPENDDDDKERKFAEASSLRSAEMIKRGALTAHKALCLTGTVMVNKIYDIENLLSIADGKAPISQNTFSKIAVNEANRYDYFKYRISMYFREIDYKTGKPSPPNPNFPEMREKFIPIISKDPKILAKPDQKTNAVYTTSRQASMTDEKIDFCINKIEEEPTKKFVIYTAFKDNVARIKQRLTSKSIKYGVISGDENTKEKQNAIKGYNEYYNKNYEGEKHRVLLITKAGAEGVDLRETRGIFIIDGVWNEALSIQIIARAIRFRSHANLPEKDRYVDVYKLFVATPEEERLINNLNGKAGEKFDFNKFIDKIKSDRELEKQIEKRKGKAYTGRSAIDNSLILKFSDKVEDFDEEKFELMKPKERKEYIQERGTFMKNREKYLANELARIGQETPSTDFYLFALQKSKEKVILEFIKAMARIPDVEQAFTDRALGKKAKDFIENAVKTNATEEEIADTLIKIMRPNLTKAMEKIEASNENLSEKLKALLAKGREADKLIADKTKNRINQEFFTPTHLVKELIELSGVNKDKRIQQGGIQVLEPSAGYGAIIKGLLKLMSNKSLDLRMDMVEILEENRKVLKELVKEVPNYLSLAEQPDFLRFVPNKAYDYILMNPPFHVRKEGKYDYDFVQRAFAMLKPGGILVAITGIKYKEFPQAIEWYKSKGAEIKIKNVEWREFEEGEKLKNKAMEIANVRIAFVKIQKSELDNKDKNWSIKEDAELQEIAPKKDDPDTLKEAVKNIEDNVDLQFNMIEKLAEPINKKISKGKLSKSKGIQDIVDEVNRMEFKTDAFSDKVSDKLAKEESKDAEKQIALANFTEPKKRGRKPKVGDPDKPTTIDELSKAQRDKLDLELMKNDVYDFYTPEIIRKKMTELAIKKGLLAEPKVDTKKEVLLSQKTLKLEELNKELIKIKDSITNRRRGVPASQSLIEKRDDLISQIIEIETDINKLKGAGFWSDFGKGFKQGFMGTLDVAKTILPFVV
jgi:predicted RNA methylase